MTKKARENALGLVKSFWSSPTKRTQALETLQIGCQLDCSPRVLLGSANIVYFGSVKLPSALTSVVSPWTVFSSQLIRLVGRWAASPPGSAHSRITTRECGAKTEFGPAATATVWPSAYDPTFDEAPVGAGVIEIDADADPDADAALAPAPAIPSVTAQKMSPTDRPDTMDARIAALGPRVN